MANPAFQNALKKIPQKAPPIWFMRQAGRYHSHYQKLREKYTFVQLCKEPELAADTAMGPIKDFDFDVSILFSDLLFPLEALGMGLEYDPGPKLDWRLDPQNIIQLKPVSEALEELTFQKLAMQATRDRLPSHKSLIGFVGGPWTLYTYAVEGGHKGPLIQAKSHLPLFERFCQTIVPLLVGNIQLQLEGGAEAVMVLDTASGEVSPSVFHHWIAPQLDKIVASHKDRLIYYSKGTTEDHLAPIWSQGQWLGVGVDYRWDMARMMKIKNRGVVQGNLDPSQLLASFDLLKHELDNYLSPIKDLNVEQTSGWVCGLGHGVLPQTPEKHVHYVVHHIREKLS